MLFGWNLEECYRDKAMKIVHVKRSKELDDSSSTNNDKKDIKTIVKLVIEL